MYAHLNRLKIINGFSFGAPRYHSIDEGSMMLMTLGLAGLVVNAATEYSSVFSV